MLTDFVIKEYLTLQICTVKSVYKYVPFMSSFSLYTVMCYRDAL